MIKKKSKKSYIEIPSCVIEYSDSFLLRVCLCACARQSTLCTERIAFFIKQKLKKYEIYKRRKKKTEKVRGTNGETWIAQIKLKSNEESKIGSLSKCSFLLTQDQSFELYDCFCVWAYTFVCVRAGAVRVNPSFQDVSYVLGLSKSRTYRNVTSCVVQ